MIAYQLSSVFRREHNHSADMFSICLFRLERKGMICVSFHFSYHFLMVQFFGMEYFYLKCSCLNATLEGSTFWTILNKMEQLGFCAKGALHLERKQFKALIKKRS